MRFFENDDDLAIGHVAQGAGILAGDAHRAAPVLGQPGSVQHQEPGGRARRREGPHALRVEGLEIPRRIGQEMLQACGGGAHHRRGDGVTVLVGQVGQ